jgi:tetratricopeptide (TPR) repeat protein
LGEEGGRGNQPSTDANLPTHNTSYSLGNILGGRRVPGAVWMGGLDVQNQLAAEYRKAAQAATAQGDFRRAAFIYGKLLRDYRQAADVLSRGGLHHDAAILYLDKLGDVLAAARAFAAAGEFDRAVQLYRQRGEHVLAGDLLRKLGEEQQAVEEYQRAVDQLYQAEHYHAAGELVLAKLCGTALQSRPDGSGEPSYREQALACFRMGWQKRPRGSPLPCLHRLFELLAEQRPPGDLLGLVDEAAEYLQRQGSESDCSSFFNEVVRIANRPTLAEMRDRLRDRSLLGLAARLRSRAQVETLPGSLVSTLFGHPGSWSSSQVNDAEVALRAALQARKVQPKPASPRSVVQMRIHEGTVFAACGSVECGKVFLAFGDGALRCFNPLDSSIDALPSLTGVPCSLATDPKGLVLLALCEIEEGRLELSSYRSFNEFRHSGLVTRKPLSDLGPGTRLSPLVIVGNEARGAIWWEDGVVVLQGDHALPVGQMQRAESKAKHEFPLLHGVLPAPTPVWNRLLLLDEQSISVCRLSTFRLQGASLGWIARPAPGTLSSQAFWMNGDEDRLDVAIARVGDEGGQLFWSQLVVQDLQKIELHASATSKSAGYLGVALLGPRSLAGIREGGIDWFRVQGRHLQVIRSNEINLTGACACFCSPQTGELLVICRDGYLLRHGIPQ